MSGFLYFVPTKTAGDILPNKVATLNLEKLPLPLREIFADRQKVPEETIAHQTEGPESLTGLILIPKRSADNEPPASILFDAQKQTWIPANSDGSYWIGWVTEDPPHPSWLEKHPMMRFYTVKAGNGTRWEVPAVHSLDRRRCQLPVSYTYDEDGNLQSHITPDNQKLWDQAGKALDHLAGIATLSETEAVNLAVEMLGINYRIGKTEVRALHEAGVGIDTNLIAGILQACCDWELYIEHAKKNTEEVPVTDLESATAGS